MVIVLDHDVGAISLDRSDAWLEFNHLYCVLFFVDYNDIALILYNNEIMLASSEESYHIRVRMLSTTRHIKLCCYLSIDVNLAVVGFIEDVLVFYGLMECGILQGPLLFPRDIVLYLVTLLLLSHFIRRIG